MGNLKEKIDSFFLAAAELESAATMAVADGRIRMTLSESREMRDRMLQAQIMGARAERKVLSIPIYTKAVEAAW